ncbi:hypothetical protein J6590_080757 [Homalodisca vitripennis]|nr:hypothetical protein J6590_080757 [Homalodisca vitripennis]
MDQSVKGYHASGLPGASTTLVTYPSVEGPGPLVSRRTASWMSSSSPPSRPVAALGPSALLSTVHSLYSPLHTIASWRENSLKYSDEGIICGAPSSQ